MRIRNPQTPPLHTFTLQPETQADIPGPHRWTHGIPRTQSIVEDISPMDQCVLLRVPGY